MEEYEEDILSAMLEAYTDGYKINDGNSAINSVMKSEDQKRYLINNIEKLSIADKKSIGNILNRNKKQEHLIPCSSGTIINLDNLHEEIIEQMYNLMIHKLKKK